MMNHICQLGSSKISNTNNAIRHMPSIEQVAMTDPLWQDKGSVNIERKCL